MIKLVAFVLAALLAAPALAELPRDSLRPVQNVPPGAAFAPNDMLQLAEAGERRGLFRSMRERAQTRRSERRARRSDRRLGQQGGICGDPAIQGEAIGPVKGTIQGCGVENAVRVRSVAGVTLSTGAVMDCQTAGALKNWMERSAKPAMSRKGGGLQSIRVAAHYACRTRNNQRGAKISEHGKGRAIDISAFRLQNGAEVTVLQGWDNRTYSKALRQMHKGACGPFGTVLGPNADRFHRDHFHFDTARYRSGSYCR